MKRKTSSPKWGTREWIAAYPWSEMDKNRRRRVKKFLGPNSWAVRFIETGMVGSIPDEVRHLKKALGLKHCTLLHSWKEIMDLDKAIVTVDNFYKMVVDCLVECDLTERWIPKT